MKFDKEIGVVSNFSCRNYNGYITFCGIDDLNQFVFREEYDDYSRVIYISSINYVENSKKVPYPNIISFCSRNNKLYVLLNKPNRIYILSHDMQIERSIEIVEPILAIHISVTNEVICVSGKPGTLLLYDRHTCIFVKRVDTRPVGVNKPMFVCHDFDDHFLIVDSTAHTVKLIDVNSNVKFSYGLNNKPGYEQNHLNSPIYACKTDHGILISENRNHRSLEVTLDGNTLRTFGIVNTISACKSGLWNPQGVYLKGETYMVMCKGCHINIKHYNTERDALENVFGTERVVQSEFNFPRSCDYSFVNDTLIVADTYHNRIISFSSAGDQLWSISNTTYGELYWPRCALWCDNKIMIGDSRHNRILFTDTDGNVEREIALDSISNGEWIQAVYLVRQNILIAFESIVYVLNIESLEPVWCSKDYGIDLEDVHHALLTEANDIIISDTGNQRLVWIRNFSSVEYYEGFYHGDRYLLLKKPRCTIVNDTNLFVLNSDAHMVLQIDLRTMCVSDIYGGERGYSREKISKPRWICKGVDDTVIISDTDNNRVISIQHQS